MFVVRFGKFWEQIRSWANFSKESHGVVLGIRYELTLSKGYAKVVVSSWIFKVIGNSEGWGSRPKN